MNGAVKIEQVIFNHSLKNIPLPSKDTYRKNLIYKLESFIKRIRWKSFFFEKKNESHNEVTTTFGLKSVKTPPKNHQLNQFRSDLHNVVQNIEFRSLTFNFQGRLSDDIIHIKKNPKLLIPTKKPNNLHEVTNIT